MAAGHFRLVRRWQPLLCSLHLSSLACLALRPSRVAPIVGGRCGCSGCAHAAASERSCKEAHMTPMGTVCAPTPHGLVFVLGQSRCALHTGIPLLPQHPVGRAGAVHPGTGVPCFASVPYPHESPGLGTYTGSWWAAFLNNVSPTAAPSGKRLSNLCLGWSRIYHLQPPPVGELCTVSGQQHPLADARQ